jgi:hypothetical protein
MEIIEILPRNRKQIRDFLDLPEQIYRGNPYWVPAFRSDVQAYFDRQKNPFYRHSDAAFFLAYDKEVCGRIAVLEPVLVNQRMGSRMAFFFLYECCETPNVSQALFHAAEGWALARGLDTLYGPKGFTALDPIGILVKGFDVPAAMTTGYHPPYYQEFITAAGFSPVVDLQTGTMTRDINFPDRIHRLSASVQEERGIRVEAFRSRQHVLEKVPELTMLFNSALGNESVNAPMNESEIRSMVRVLMLIARPDIIKMIRKDDEAIGFLLAYPDVSRAIQRNRGRILPFGWLRMMVEARRTTRFDINGVGILEEHRGAGGLAVLYSELYRTLITSKGQQAEIIQIRVENEKMLRTLRGFGIDFNRIHRMYQKEIRKD